MSSFNSSWPIDTYTTCLAIWFEMSCFKIKIVRNTLFEIFFFSFFHRELLSEMLPASFPNVIRCLLVVTMVMVAHTKGNVTTQILLTDPVVDDALKSREAVHRQGKCSFDL